MDLPCRLLPPNSTDPMIGNWLENCNKNLAENEKGAQFPAPRFQESRAA